MGKQKKRELRSIGPEEFIIKFYRGSSGWRVVVGEFSKGVSRDGLIRLGGEFKNLAEAERAGKQYLREVWVY